MNRNTAAFIIAILVHLLLFLLFVIVGYMAPKMDIKKNETEEKRYKVSLKERPKTEKESFEKKTTKEIEIAPPLPKGEQLNELIKKPFKKYDEKEIVEQKKQEVLPPKKVFKPIKEKKTVTQTLPEIKDYIKSETSEFTAPKEQNLTEVEPAYKGENSDLFAILTEDTKPQKSNQKSTQNLKDSSRLTQDIKELYGDVFGKLSEGEQKYILDNQEIMRRITQEVLNRVGRVNIPNDFGVNAFNTVEFYLMPNGDITEIKYLQKSGHFILDNTTKETIEYSYSRYPHPKQKTLIRYRVGYYFR